VLIFVNVAATVVVALMAYQAAHDALMNEAFHTVAQAAHARGTALENYLLHRQQRLEGFAQSVQSLCAERGPNGGLGWEDGCVGVALGGLFRSEGAAGVELAYRDQYVGRRGERLPLDRWQTPGLASVRGVVGRGDYEMRAVRGDLLLRARFPLTDLIDVLAERSGLGAYGELFLIDASGYRLTPVDRAVIDPFPAAPQLAAVCRDGSPPTGQIVDDRGIPVVTGLERTTAVGGGCIVANMTYEAATAPIRRLAGLFVVASVMVMLAGAVVSGIAAEAATRPIKRLVGSARALAAGRFDTDVHESGPAEVRHLAAAFSAMSTSIHELLEREQQARREAEGANRMKDEFLATLSHELRTPLNAILGWASIMSRGGFDEARVRQAVRVIERNARIQSQMVEELLDISRIAAGNLKLSLADVPVRSFVDAALEAIRPTADVKSVPLESHIEVAPLVRGDARRLQQIVWNLLSNAVRYTPSGGRVDVTVRQAAGTVEIEVSDTGIGINRGFLPHVFERFRQADGGTTRSQGGLGLGLAIVRELVDLHAGTVEARSEGEGRGATFLVRLPAATIATRIDLAATRSLHARSLEGKRVLVVDDDPDAREVVRAILEDAGAEVQTTSSARESRAVFVKSHPDLLIADIGMPEEDGYSLIRSIRRLEAGSEPVPAIALTAHSRPEDVDQALASGFQLHVAKPIDSQRLVASVATLVETANPC
jgi:signal transduction histidine kinase/CheY-like chemotaxis protein